jgi:serine/threonine protein kinase
MEYGGTRLQAYARKHSLIEEQIKHLFSQICSGVHQIHSKSIMHRDLCLENILISTINNNLLKIIDFDHAIEYTGGRESAQGLINAMAPEVYHQKRYNNKADIWSLGIILYELFHKRNPFVDE